MCYDPSSNAIILPPSSDLEGSEFLFKLKELTTSVPTDDRKSYNFYPGNTLLLFSHTNIYHALVTLFKGEQILTGKDRTVAPPSPVDRMMVFPPDSDWQRTMAKIIFSEETPETKAKIINPDGLVEKGELLCFESAIMHGGSISPMEGLYTDPSIIVGRCEKKQRTGRRCM